MRKRLAISKETLSVLTTDELAGVVGAAVRAWTEPCVEDLRDYVNRDLLDFGGGESTVICI